jgi:hypothetical protein
VETFQTGSRLYIKTMQEFALISDEVWFTLNTNINSQNNTGSYSSFYMNKSVWCAVSMHKIIGLKLVQEKHSGHYVQLILAPCIMGLTEENVEQSTFFIRTGRENVGISS